MCQTQGYRPKMAHQVGSFHESAWSLHEPVWELPFCRNSCARGRRIDRWYRSHLPECSLFAEYGLAYGTRLRITRRRALYRFRAASCAERALPLFASATS